MWEDGRKVAIRSCGVGAGLHWIFAHRFKYNCVLQKENVDIPSKNQRVVVNLTCEPISGGKNLKLRLQSLNCY